MFIPYTVMIVTKEEFLSIAPIPKEIKVVEFHNKKNEYKEHLIKLIEYYGKIRIEHSNNMSLFLSTVIGIMDLEHLEKLELVKLESGLDSLGVHEVNSIVW